MPQDVGVVIIHGMGSQKEDFAVEMVKHLKAEVEKHRQNPDRIAFQAIWWAPILDDKERRLMTAMLSHTRLDWIQLRTFVLNNLADSVAYHKSYAIPDAQNERPVYTQITQAVAMEMNELAQKVRPTSPLVVIAHSLGCHIMSNYIWDTQTRGSERKHVIDPGSPFENCETLTAIKTFGCNIPLFLLSNENIEPIHFPGKNVGLAFPGQPAGKIESVAQWTNFFDRDDVLGWPLAPLSPAYGKVVKDVQVNVGNWFSSATPLSHDRYWTDNNVIGPIGASLAGILSLL
jgi:hypothetical protein